jgi:hypothetical protein
VRHGWQPDRFRVRRARLHDECRPQAQAPAESGGSPGQADAEERQGRRPVHQPPCEDRQQVQRRRRRLDPRRRRAAVRPRLPRHLLHSNRRPDRRHLQALEEARPLAPERLREADGHRAVHLRRLERPRQALRPRRPPPLRRPQGLHRNRQHAKRRRRARHRTVELPQAHRPRDPRRRPPLPERPLTAGRYSPDRSRYPIPRTVSIRSSPSFLRRYPTYTSTTFDPGS